MAVVRVTDWKNGGKGAKYRTSDEKAARYVQIIDWPSSSSSSSSRTRCNRNSGSSSSIRPDCRLPRIMCWPQISRRFFPAIDRNARTPCESSVCVCVIERETTFTACKCNATGWCGSSSRGVWVRWGGWTKEKDERQADWWDAHTNHAV